MSDKQTMQELKENINDVMLVAGLKAIGDNEEEGNLSGEEADQLRLYVTRLLEEPPIMTE